MARRTTSLILGAVLTCWIPGIGQAEYPRLPIVYPEPAADTVGLDPVIAELSRLADDRDLGGLQSHLAPDFFWDRDFGGGFDAGGKPLDNLAAALSLRDADLLPEFQGSGWRRLSSILRSPTRGTYQARKDVVCLPGEPVFANPAQAEATIERTVTEGWFDWGYIPGADVEVLAQPDSSGAAVGTLSREAVRVHEWFVGPEDSPWAAVETPAGKLGFIPQDQVSSRAPERLCFLRDGIGSWKIAGYVGGGD